MAILSSFGFSCSLYTGDLMYIKTFPTLNSLITLYTLQVLPIFKARGCPYLMDLFLVWIATY